MALPSGYTKLEYIESTGTQYIDTGVVPTISTRFEVDFRPTKQGQDDGVIGVVDPNACIVYTASTVYGSFKQGTGASATVNATVTDRHKASIANGAFVLDGTTHSFSTISSFSTAQKVLMFALAYTGVSGGVYGKSSCRMYAAKIYSGSALVRDYIPCKNTSGVVGMWDDVNSQFYTNAGTGAFTAGSEIHEGGVFVKVNGVWKQVDNITVNVN